jgi:hypothetical protein
VTATFADELKLFALTCDVIDSDHFKQISRLIERYCEDTLFIQSIKFWEADDYEGPIQLKLHSSLSGTAVKTTRPIKDEKGAYSNQAALAYDNKQSLWLISSTGKERLENANGVTDQWSGKRSIPAYRSDRKNEKRSEVKTCIIVVVQFNDAPLGLLVFETNQYIEATDEAKSELEILADTYGVLIHRYQSYQSQRSGTDAALQKLDETLAKPHPKLTKPKIFLAHSARASDDVVRLIIKTLDAYEDKLELVNWEKIDQPGNITQQLLDAMSQCRYGICYLSEPEPEAPNRFRDNANVVFEAGMFHGRRDELTSEPASWIPVREVLSVEVPFDFAQERIITVERYQNGKLRSGRFGKALRRRLGALLSSAA